MSRSAMWITLVPVAWLSRANDPSARLSASAISFSNAALFDAGRRRQSSLDHRRRDFEQRPLGEVAHEAGIRAVIDDRGRDSLARELSRSFSYLTRIWREYRLRSYGDLFWISPYGSHSSSEVLM